MPEPLHEPNSLSLTFLEEVYETYQQDPESVAPDWRRYFESLANGGHRDRPGAPLPPLQHIDPRHPATLAPMEGTRCGICGRAEALSALQHRVDQLIRNYRVRAHRVARVNPLRLPTEDLPELDPAYYGLGEEHMGLLFSTSTLSDGAPLSLRTILERLRNTYCRSIGVQFMHIDDIHVREWLQERMERHENRLKLKRDEQLRILTRLTDAVIFEEFIQKKFTGAKRFSLEGAESLIPLLDLAIECAGDQEIEEIVVGMAHRGRLNVLANIMGKHPRQIFREFEDVEPQKNVGGGDVKYHLGYHNDWITSNGYPVHLALCFNPSHLEFVNPVAMGRARAKMDRLGDTARDHGMVLLIHGDAAFIGEGVVQESLNLSELAGYSTGGTLHVVINNQIGFTTTPNEGRSCVYATDVAKMLQIPIFHVNGEDPEAVAQVVRLAMAYRRTFKRDVVIDMYCYRRHGHNEADEPAFTQPLLYRVIRKRQSVRDGYLEHLLDLGEVTREEADAIADTRRARLEEELAVAHDEQLRNETPKGRTSILGRVWRRYRGGLDRDVPDVDTGVARERLSRLMLLQTELPSDFRPHKKMGRFLEGRQEMARGERSLDWAAAEALAFASLLTEGYHVRLSGQDSARGTFSQRHAVLFDAQNGQPYMPLRHLSSDQAAVDIINSPLSEIGVLGFEYGYSIAYPDGLVMWEAQFGDFANTAQVLIDQGITSAEDKWRSLSGLVMLLPHGFEGMGPEHSSARLERFLALSAEDNIQVANLTTPAQYFHILRRQVLRTWRKPLVIMTPKSLLRHPRAVSPLDDLATGQFQHVIPDTLGIKGKARRVLICSGKVYYDLEEEREKRGINDIPIIRLEQYYPLREQALEAAMSAYPDDVPVYWVQEEPENMGACNFLRLRHCDRLLGRWRFGYIARAASASPATGSHSSHRLEQQQILDAALGDE